LHAGNDIIDILIRNAAFNIGIAKIAVDVLAVLASDAFAGLILYALYVHS
jgi:hypothetical protein